MADARPFRVPEDTDDAVPAWCAVRYVTAEPRARPYCGGEEVSPGHALAIRPE
jgi:hypothetical protein